MIFFRVFICRFFNLLRYALETEHQIKKCRRIVPLRISSYLWNAPNCWSNSNAIFQGCRFGPVSQAAQTLVKHQWFKIRRDGMPPVAGTHPATWKFLAPSLHPHSPAILEVNLPVDRLPGRKSTTRQGCFPSCKCDTGWWFRNPIITSWGQRFIPLFTALVNPTSLELY